MTFMSKESEALLKKLVQLAGSPVIVEESLRELSQELPQAPTLEELITRILTKRAQQQQRHAKRPIEELVSAR